MRAYSNLSMFAERDGDLRSSVELARNAEAMAQRLGNRRDQRWTRGNRVGMMLLTGEWHECGRAADQGLQDSTALGPHYLDGEAYLARARLNLAYGRVDAAVADQVEGLASGRRAKDPQIVYAALAISAFVLAEAGQLPESRELLDELMATVREDEVDLLVQASTQAALAAESTGRREALRLWLGPADGSVWTQASGAVLDSDFEAAVSLLEPMGAVYLASLIRLRAGEHLVQAGRRREAEEMLRPAIAFFESVGATRYLQAAQLLLAA
jgi:ATP/maltotriose-dependent transcriptional regulator MalT